MSTDLPAELTAASTPACGFSRNDAAARSDAISQTYRSGGGSTTIRSERRVGLCARPHADMTHAAVIASLNALQETSTDFAPITLPDCGAGPGTATWARAEAFASLNAFTLLDASPACARLRSVWRRQATASPR